MGPELHQRIEGRRVRPLHRPGWLRRQQRVVLIRGGAAVVSDNSRVLDPTRTFVVATTDDSTRWGATVGAGIEFGFAPNWSVGVEYDHIFLEDRTHSFLNNGVLAPAGVMFGTDSISLDVDLVSGRVN
jgi:outer membrane immunogenic protein